MGRYDSHKNPFQYRMNAWSHRQINSGREQEPKSMPCHVTKIEKDFVHVAFETKNSVFTPPVMKMTQAFSRFGREPTQKGDKGMAVPGDYYMGGITQFAGGGTNFYPRGNLSSLSFNPASNLKAPKRDYDQHWETGGPKGWKVKVMERRQEQQQQQNGQSGTIGGLGGGTGSPGSAQIQRNFTRIMQQRLAIIPFNIQGRAANGNGSSGNGQSNQQDQEEQEQQQRDKDKTEFSFDKDGKALMRSVDDDNYFYIDQKNSKIEMQGKDKLIHQSEKPEHSVRIDKNHVHIRFENNRIWVDKAGCWSSKPIQVKQDPYD
jgi:hypothetical protein